MVVLVARVAVAAPAKPAPVTVAIDLAALDANAYRALDALSLEKRVVLRLIEDGFAVVAATAHPELVLRVSRTPASVTVAIDGPLGARTRDIPHASEPLPELHLEVAQRASDLAREQQAEVIARRPPPPSVPTTPMWWTTTVRAGVLNTTPAAAPVIELAQRWSRGRLDVVASLAWDRMTEREVSLDEIELSVGGLARAHIGRRVAIAGGLRTGFVRRHVSLAQPYMTSHGPFDLAAAVLAEGRVLVAPHIELALSSRFGGTLSGIRYTKGMMSLERGATRIDVGVSVGYRW